MVLIHIPTATKYNWCDNVAGAEGGSSSLLIPYDCPSKCDMSWLYMISSDGPDLVYYSRCVPSGNIPIGPNASRYARRYEFCVVEE